jgi:biopolymer transport protein ExbB
MCPNKWRIRSRVEMAASGLVVLAVCVVAGGADDPGRIDPADDHVHHVEGWAWPGTDGGGAAHAEPLEIAAAGLRRAAGGLMAWYLRTPPADRVTWGGMTACAGLGVLVVLERLLALRRRRIIPRDFTARFLDRLHEGRLDCGQALDHCELNPSPAARVALAAVRRWGRPASDQERAVALAHRVESERLRRNVGTLRRIAGLAPLLGLLGSLFAVGRVLEAMPAAPSASPATDVATAMGGTATTSGAALGPALASALTPLCTGIVIATLALVAYDGLLIRIEKLAGALDRLGAETIDAIAMTAPLTSPISVVPPAPAVAALSRTEHAPESPHARHRGPHQSYARAEERRQSSPRASQEDGGF